MPATSVGELQQKLFKQMGIETATPSSQHNSRGKTVTKRKRTSRKEDRKAQRLDKKANRYAKVPKPNAAQAVGRAGFVQKIAHKSVENQTKRNPTPSTNLETEHSDSEHDLEHDMGSTGEIDLFESDEDSDEEEEEEEESRTLANSSKPSQSATTTKRVASIDGSSSILSKTARDKLAEDDAEIEEFERKLGIKKGRKSLPKSFAEDGLGDLLGEIAAPESDDEDRITESKKRKHDYDEWLSSKRRATVPAGSKDDIGNTTDDEIDDDHSQSFEGFSSDDEGQTREQPRRENPYVAPVSGNSVAKYVPPFMRAVPRNDSEQRIRLEKTIQGLINRLTDANILSIAQSAEELYQTNARGDVTEILTMTLLAQICKPENIPDQFFVLIGGFAAALYKIIGASFGSYIVRRLVEDISKDCQRTKDTPSDEKGIRKETSNLVGFLTQLYVFEAINCKVILDFMERFLEDLSELNVELLLRICRIAGRLLRRDDPQALKHIASVLNSGLKGNYNNISARTKFMVETINDLKNSKAKTKGHDSAIVSEHVVRMKKRIGELKSQTRRLDGLAPMGFSLADVESADTLGKWWLVGASVPVKSKTKQSTTNAKGQEQNSGTDDEDMDFILPDYPQKARAQGFSTSGQIAIFTAIMSASDSENGYRQYVNLKLKKDDQIQIAHVLVQCVGSEGSYNEYYSLLAQQACANSRVRFAFQDRLWKIFRSLGESLFGDEEDDEQTADGERMKDRRRLKNVACFYAALVAHGGLSITILKPLDLPQLSSWTSLFVEAFLVNLLQEFQGKDEVEKDKIQRIFGSVAEVPILGAGLHWFLRKKISSTKLVKGKALQKVERRCQIAQTLVQEIRAS